MGHPNPVGGPRLLRGGGGWRESQFILREGPSVYCDGPKLFGGLGGEGRGLLLRLGVPKPI